MMNVLLAFEAEVARFQTWADTNFCPGEWECNYDNWPRLYKAFTDFITTPSSSQWSVATIQLLLYSIARDNEIEYLIKELAKNPDQLLFLAEQAVTSTEQDARWQIAAALGRLETRQPQVEPLLLRFAHDKDEYVRRRALHALAEIGSAHIEALVEPAWATGDEYQRMTVLYALFCMNSPQLDHYLAQAEADGRHYLVAYAARTVLAKRLALVNYQETLGPLQQAAMDAGVDRAIAQQLPPYMHPLDDTWTVTRIAEHLQAAGFPRNQPSLSKVAAEIWCIYHSLNS